MPTRRDFLAKTAATASMIAVGSTQTDLAVAKNSADSGSKAPMKTYTIRHTDLVVSRIAYGCAMLGLDWNSPDFVARTVPNIRTAYDQGITFFDTADVYGYGKAEAALGKIFKESPGFRNTIVLQTKCGDRFTEGGSADNSREHILRSVEGSLRRLNTDRLDVLLLHWPDSLVEPEKVAKAFDELHKSGKVRYFGVSNHNPYQIELLQRVVRQPLVFNQIQLGLAHWYTEPGPDKGAFVHGFEGVQTLDYCRAHDIQLQAYSPLRAGNVGKPPNLLNPASDATPEVKKAAQALADVAAGHSTSPSAVMLAWLLHHPAHIIPIIGTTKPAHVIDNCTADRVELTRMEWYSLLDAAAQIESPTV